MTTWTTRFVVGTLLVVPMLLGMWGGFCVTSMLAQYDVLAVPFVVAFIGFSAYGFLLVLFYEVLYVILPVAALWLLVKFFRKR
jgi:hypothetical protein